MTYIDITYLMLFQDKDRTDELDEVCGMVLWEHTCYPMGDHRSIISQLKGIRRDLRSGLTMNQVISNSYQELDFDCSKRAPLVKV